jgi:pimeloyl-ACP methyl ester carboxylesterase
VVPGAGHVIHADKPEAVVEAVLEVLKSIGAP